jgi:hypothetical protein
MYQLPAVSVDELDAQSLEVLPDRETLCNFACVNLTNIVGVNLAIAINAASFNVEANAIAGQALAGWLQP